MRGNDLRCFHRGRLFRRLIFRRLFFQLLRNDGFRFFKAFLCGSLRFFKTRFRCVFRFGKLLLRCRFRFIFDLRGVLLGGFDDGVGLRCCFGEFLFAKLLKRSFRLGLGFCRGRCVLCGLDVLLWRSEERRVGKECL